MHGRLRFGDGALRGGLVGGGALRRGGGGGVMLRHGRRLLRALRDGLFELSLLASPVLHESFAIRAELRHRLREPGVEGLPALHPGGELAVVRRRRAHSLSV